MKYEITIEGEDEVLATVNSIDEVNEWVKNYIVNNFDMCALDEDVDDYIDELQIPWLWCIDETGLPLRFEINKVK